MIVLKRVTLETIYAHQLALCTMLKLLIVQPSHVTTETNADPELYVEGPSVMSSYCAGSSRSRRGQSNWLRRWFLNATFRQRDATAFAEVGRRDRATQQLYIYQHMRPLFGRDLAV